MHVAESTIRSKLLGNERRLWLQSPATGQPAGSICILLDGEYYVEAMEAPALIAELQAAQKIPAIAVAYVSHVDGQTRWRESFCNADFAQFASQELSPHVRGHFRVSGDVPAILGGLSLTGLAAAHAAMSCPEGFAGVLCQSASFWWSDNQIVGQVRPADSRPLRFRISVGSAETKDYVQHAPSLIQRTSQLAANRMMRDALLEKGHHVSYEEFEGGHDIASWKADLGPSLAALLTR